MKFFLFCSFFIYLNLAFAQTDLELSHYHESLISIQEDLTLQHPPSDFVYLGIGRSAGLLGLYLEHAGFEVHLLPLSGLSSYKPAQLNAFAAEFRDHLSQHLPPSDKKIVIFDFTYSGRSLLNASLLVQKALNLSSPPDVYALVGREERRDVRDLFSQNPEVPFKSYALSGYDHFYRALYNSEVDHFAPYGEHLLGQDQAVSSNPDFAQEREKVFKFLDRQQDPLTSRPQHIQCKSLL